MSTPYALYMAVVRAPANPGIDPPYVPPLALLAQPVGGVPGWQAAADYMLANYAPSGSEVWDISLVHQPDFDWSSPSAPFQLHAIQYLNTADALVTKIVIAAAPATHPPFGGPLYAQNETTAADPDFASFVARIPQFPIALVIN